MPAIGTERCRTADNQCTTVRQHHTDFKIAVLVFQCLTGQAPGYLAEDCQRSLYSISRHSDLYHAPHVQHLRQLMLHSCQSTAMELAANQSKTVSQSGKIQAFI